MDKQNYNAKTSMHTSRKKKKHLPILISFLVLLLLICVYLTFITVPAMKKSTLGQMVNYCHNRGSIEFYVNSKLMDPLEMKVVRTNGDIINEKALTEDGEFAFFSGKRGVDTYSFFVDKDMSERYKDIQVKFINHNDKWWYVNNFDIEFDITKKKDKISLKGTCYLNGEKIDLKADVQEKKDLYYFEIPLREK